MIVNFNLYVSLFPALVSNQLHLDDGEPAADGGLQQGDQPGHEEDRGDDVAARRVICPGACHDTVNNDL